MPTTLYTLTNGIQFTSKELETANVKTVLTSDDISLTSLNEKFITGDYTENNIHTLNIALRQLVKVNLKIDAIKLLRAFTEWGLKECKDYVDSL